MQTPVRIAVCASLLLVFVSASGFGQTPYVKTTTEELYGTWVSKTNNPHKLVLMPDGTYEAYSYEADTQPVYLGSFEIVDKWMDTEGNIWYKEIVVETSGSGKGLRTLELDRISQSGITWEYVYNFVPQSNVTDFPNVIDPKAYSYGNYNKKTKVESQ